MALVTLVQKVTGRVESEARLEREDVPWLLAAVVAGGVVGPILLMVGLRSTPAATASLLLNVEVVATGLLARAFFRERIGLATGLAMAAVAVAGGVLSLDGTSPWGMSLGGLAVVGACFAWGVDNNLTARVSLKDPKRIVAIKGISAGLFSIALAMALGRPWPSLSRSALALALGAMSYGASIALFVHSLRRVGAARTGALFGMAPFIGAGLSLVVFRSVPGWSFWVSFLLMAVAALALARERHAHEHEHAPATHAHAHRHDDGHHNHVHEDRVPEAARHAHLHAHRGVVHSHPHRPDPHHRHDHEPQTATKRR
jgi:drug/metabolite transporter (DMT)-like permease